MENPEPGITETNLSEQGAQSASSQGGPTTGMMTDGEGTANTGQTQAQPSRTRTRSRSNASSQAGVTRRNQTNAKGKQAQQRTRGATRGASSAAGVSTGGGNIPPELAGALSGSIASEWNQKMPALQNRQIFAKRFTEFLAGFNLSKT